MVLVYKSRVFVANVGDSRAVLYSLSEKEKVISQPLSIDHTPTIEAETKRIL